MIMIYTENRINGSGKFDPYPYTYKGNENKWKKTSVMECKSYPDLNKIAIPLLLQKRTNTLRGT